MEPSSVFVSYIFPFLSHSHPFFLFFFRGPPVLSESSLRVQGSEECFSLNAILSYTTEKLYLWQSSSMSVTNEVILEELKKNRQELRSLIEAVEVRITLKIEDLNRRINTLEFKNAENTDRIERLERKSRENNIIIFGLESKPENISTDFIKCEIKKLVDVNITEGDLNNFYPLGKAKNPPIKIEFTSFLKKTEVLKNAKNLKGTRVSMVRDLTFKQRQEYIIF